MHANGRSGARQSQRSRSTKTCRRPETSSHFRVRSSKRARLFAPPLPAQSCRRAQEVFPHSAASTVPLWPQPRPREEQTRPRDEHGLSGAHSLDQHVSPADGRGRKVIFAAASEWGSYAEVARTHSQSHSDKNLRPLRVASSPHPLKRRRRTSGSSKWHIESVDHAGARPDATLRLRARQRERRRCWSTDAQSTHDSHTRAACRVS